MPCVWNMPKYWIGQGSLYAQRSGLARICLDRVLNISWVLNMLGSWKWQDSEHVRVTQGFKYVTIWLNMSELDLNMPEYVWIYDNIQGFKYVSYNT